jgi:hypothetical protein
VEVEVPTEELVGALSGDDHLDAERLDLVRHEEPWACSPSSSSRRTSPCGRSHLQLHQCHPDATINILFSQHYCPVGCGPIGKETFTVGNGT